VDDGLTFLHVDSTPKLPPAPVLWHTHWQRPVRAYFRNSGRNHYAKRFDKQSSMRLSVRSELHQLAI
jgi:hypothetical protein